MDACAHHDGATVFVGGARGSDLIATVPERHTEALRAGSYSFALPFKLPSIRVSMMWHPRMHADPAHAWLRDCVYKTAGDKNVKP